MIEQCFNYADSTIKEINDFLIKSKKSRIKRINEEVFYFFQDKEEQGDTTSKGNEMTLAP